jgi:glutathione S-transferase
MAIKLYDLCGAERARRFSPYCWRIRLALAHKGLAVEAVPWLMTDKAAIAFAGSTTVPVLVDGERSVADSWTIANYLEDTYPDRPSLFEGAGGRAASRMVAQWTESVVHTGLARFVMLDIYHHLDPADRDYFRRSREQRVGATLEAFCADRDRHLESFRKSLEPLRRTLGLQKYLGGDHPLFADYLVFGAFQWARAISPYQVLEGSDPIAKWREQMLDLFDGLARKAPGYPV